ncbi:hypothetical protein Zmor_000807 [Zophobas morio]|uniref:Cytochrome P450 n=1 Tax=Zophobas morio TaxID=2755281 RepID=A0AA38J5F7_9CUCU|nr:hypothetical protein Zmor_000807 [Zophobas morio]
MFVLHFLVTLLVLAVVYIVHRSSQILDYWKKRGVKYVKPLPIVGNMLPTITGSKSIAELIRYFYNAFPSERYVGIFQFSRPILLIRDPELIKIVTIKNFENFVDHLGFISAESDPLWGKNLFASQGERWRDLRQTLSPAFTSSKMRTMFSLMQECAKQLVTYFKDQNNSIVKVDLKDIFSRYATDVIATTAFGIKCDSLKFKNNEFLLAGKEFSDFSGIKRFKFLIYGNYPKLTKFFKLKIVPDRVGNFFRGIIDETIRLREEKNIIRPDLIHLLMLSRKGKLKYEDYMNLPKEGFAAVEESEIGRVVHNPNYLSNEDITAQALVFFLGGYDTISSTTSFVGYELAINPQIQQKLRQEISKTHKTYGDNITYEQLLDIKYLDMVVAETLRKWPQAIWLDRKCTKAFEITPERSGESPIKINEGDICWIPVYGLHMDPNYFPNPDVFDPERFSDENAKNIKAATFLPFGSGPRNCIGSRFALLEAKIILYNLLLEFEFVPTEETQNPIKIKRDSVLLLAEKGFPVGFKRSVIS